METTLKDLNMTDTWPETRIGQIAYLFCVNSKSSVTSPILVQLITIEFSLNEFQLILQIQVAMTKSGSGIVIRDIAYQAEGTFLAIVMESMFLFLFFSLSIRRNTKRQCVWQADFFYFQRSCSILIPTEEMEDVTEIQLCFTFNFVVVRRVACRQ